MKEIKFNITKNESDWVEHFAKQHDLTANTLIYQLAFSLVNLQANGSMKDQAIVLEIIAKYMVEPT